LPRERVVLFCVRRGITELQLVPYCLFVGSTGWFPHCHLHWNHCWLYIVGSTGWFPTVISTGTTVGCISWGVRTRQRYFHFPSYKVAIMLYKHSHKMKTLHCL